MFVHNETNNLYVHKFWMGSKHSELKSGSVCVIRLTQS